MNDAELLAFHRRLVSTPSVSHDEAAIMDLTEAVLRERGARPVRFGQNVFAVTGKGPTIVLCTHLDTVPAGTAWTRDPWTPEVVDGRVYGLGSNDAKAAAAAMTSVFLRAAAHGGIPGATLVLLLVCEEETGGKGAEIAVPELVRRGFDPKAAIIGEPTGLGVATAQKGLLALELEARATPCHAANARSMGVVNPIRAVATDLVGLDRVDLGADHPLLGPVTLEPTVVEAGSARNQVPGRAWVNIDVRTNPGEAPEALFDRLRAAVKGSELRLRSSRLAARETAASEAIVKAALDVSGKAPYGSRGLSDWVWFKDIPAVKCGPGDTARSHSADEWVWESEILDGARFYEAAVRRWVAVSATGAST